MSYMIISICYCHLAFCPKDVCKCFCFPACVLRPKINLHIVDDAQTNWVDQHNIVCSVLLLHFLQGGREGQQFVHVVLNNTTPTFK